jgi:hypothetical protein
MIKIVNQRNSGDLFHYAHFILDCLFPEIINDLYKYKQVIRELSINQTIGNFKKIYENVMLNTNVELVKEKFNELDIHTLICDKKEKYINKIYFDKFRNFLFARYNINPFIFDNTYPEIILVKRYGRINLLNNDILNKINKNITTGKERREIKNINIIGQYLQTKYGDKFLAIFFEFLSFEQQIKYFNNAKLIICVHGAVMANMFFCKENTKIIEVTCNKKYPFFDNISNILKLQHIKCNVNTTNAIIDCINKNM